MRNLPSSLNTSPSQPSSTNTRSTSSISTSLLPPRAHLVSLLHSTHSFKPKKTLSSWETSTPTIPPGTPPPQTLLQLAGVTQFKTHWWTLNWSSSTLTIPPASPHRGTPHLRTSPLPPLISQLTPSGTPSSPATPITSPSSSNWAALSP